MKGQAEVSPHVSGLRHVIEVLVRWNMLSADAPASALESELDLEVSSVSVPAVNVRTGILDFLDAHPFELAVIATHKQKGLAHWLDARRAKEALRKTDGVILFLRDGERGIVGLKRGEIKLQKVLVPIDNNIDFSPSIYRLNGLLESLDPRRNCTFCMSARACAEFCRQKKKFRRQPILTRQGPVVQRLFEVAHRLAVDLIAMPTGGRHGLLGALHGSVTAADSRRRPLAPAGGPSELRRPPTPPQ